MKFLLITGIFSVLFAMAQNVRADEACVPSSAVVCTISESVNACGPSPTDDGAGGFYVSTSVQSGVNYFSYSSTVDGLTCSANANDRIQAHTKAMALANQLKEAGVCKFVVDQTNF